MGNRSQGGQKKRYKDTLEVPLKDFNIPTGFWKETTHDRAKWRCLIRKVQQMITKQRESAKLRQTPPANYSHAKPRSRKEIHERSSGFAEVKLKLSTNAARCEGLSYLLSLENIYMKY